MGLMQHVLAASAWATLALTAPAPQNGGYGSPCAEVSSSVAAQAGVATPTVGAEVAYDCINSVPLNQSAALNLIKTVKPYFRWQSTTNWLKDPPAEYVEKVQDAVDVWGELETIEENVKSGHYTKEYEFGFALYTLTQSTHDGHFVYVPDSVGGVFNFGRPIPLVSISEDGKSLPEPYAYQDILASTLGNSTFKPSKIVEINGKDAKEYLEDLAQKGSLQDRDALYNNVFYELAVVSQGASGAGMGTFTGGGRGRWVYPGPTTELTFANGSSVQFPNFARVLIPFTGIQSGEDLYRARFATNASTEAGINKPGQPAPTETEDVSIAAATPAPGYPAPVVRAGNNAIGGYYLEDENYADVAVLSIPSYAGAGGANSQADFQQIGRDFVLQASKAGKKKLIVDVSANGGGTILLGYDVFKYLFPNEEGFAAGDRFRSFESTYLLGEKYSEVAGMFPRTLDPSLEDVEGNIVASIFNYRTNTKVDGSSWTSWDEEIGPVENKGDQFSELVRWNLSDVLTLYNGGFSNISNEPEPIYPQPFSVEDVVVVTDGYCASTCTIFSELMRQVAKVKYISLGGRGTKEGITQAVGGVKGTNNFGWPTIQAQVALVYNWSTPEEAAAYDKTQLIEYNDNLPFLRAASTPNINFRDGIRPDDAEGVPLQFVYEESDCRILYTAEMTVDVTSIWKAVADSAWGEKSHCIAGDLGGGYGYGRTRRTTRPRLPLRRRDLKIEDYPMDIYTDESKADFTAEGYMKP